MASLRTRKQQPSARRSSSPSTTSDAGVPAAHWRPWSLRTALPGHAVDASPRLWRLRRTSAPPSLGAGVEVLGFRACRAAGDRCRLLDATQELAGGTWCSPLTAWTWVEGGWAHSTQRSSAPHRSGFLTYHRLVVLGAVYRRFGRREGRREGQRGGRTSRRGRCGRRGGRGVAPPARCAERQARGQAEADRFHGVVSRPRDERLAAVGGAHQSRRVRAGVPRHRTPAAVAARAYNVEARRSTYHKPLNRIYYCDGASTGASTSSSSSSSASISTSHHDGDGNNNNGKQQEQQQQQQQQQQLIEHLLARSWARASRSSSASCSAAGARTDLARQQAELASSPAPSKKRPKRGRRGRPWGR